jgi:hypothetical protein
MDIKPTTYKGPERRRYKRITRNFVANFKLRLLEGQEDHGAGWNMVTIKNLGAGGALFNYDREMEMDSVIDMKINFPLSPVPLTCAGKVIRIEKTGGSTLVRIAAVFVEIEDSVKETINSAAEKFYSKKPGAID